MTTTDSWHAWRAHDRVVWAQRYGYAENEQIGMFLTPELATEAAKLHYDVHRLTDVILNEIPGEPATPDSAIEVAIRLLREAQLKRDPWYVRTFAWVASRREVELTGRG